jgi:hypothetical protein
MKNGKTKSNFIPEYWHMHRCDCGFIWAHSDENRNNDAAHTCPRCRRMVGSKYNPTRPCEVDFVGCGVVQDTKI